MSLADGLKKLEMELPQARCRNRCKFCSNYGGQTVEEALKREETFGIVDDFADIGGQTLVMSGGEPIECPFVYELVEHAKEKKLWVYLYSSGYKLDEGNVRKLRSLDVDRLYVTIHGTEATHDAIADLNGSYRASISGVERLAKEGIYVGINFIPMKVNRNEWKQVFEATTALGIREFRFIEFMPQGRGWDNRSALELGSEEYRGLLVELSRDLPTLAESTTTEVSTAGVNFGFLINESMFPPPVCSAGKSGLTITPEGYMIPCLGCRTKPGSRTPDAKYILGRYRLEPPDFLRHVWNTSPVLKMFRDLTPDKLKGDCKHCTELTRCKGGCPIRREIQTGDVATGPDYKCIMPLLLQG